MKRDVVGVGALNVDFIYEVNRLVVAEKSYVPGSEIFEDKRRFRRVKEELDQTGKLVRRSAGGSAANTVYALAKMGFKTGILGITGIDELGDFILYSMNDVDYSHVKRLDDTGVCLSLVSRGERSLIVFPNANDMFSISIEDIGYLNESRIVHMSSFVGDRGLNEQKKIAKELDAGVMLSFDPGEIYARKGLRAIKTILRRCDILFINERELQLLTSNDVVEGSKMLLETGPEIVACKMGEKGSIIVTDTDEITISPTNTVVVDKTGAGDVYDAGFLAGILMDWPIEKCGNFASFVAGRSIAYYGRDGYPDKDTIKIFDGVM
ncbi:MAG: PfkB family carbohydrate kinase [Methanomassiliicoccales archaeon]